MYYLVWISGATNRLEAGRVRPQGGSGQLSRHGLMREEKKLRAPVCEKDGLRCRFRGTSFDVLVGTGLSGPGADRLREVVTGLRWDSEPQTKRGHHEIPEHL